MTDLSKPVWYKGEGEYAWDGLDETTKQYIINNPDDAEVKLMASDKEAEEDVVEETTETVGDEPAADVVPDDAPIEKETDAERYAKAMAKKVDATFKTAMSQATDTKEASRKAVVKLYEEIERTWGEGGGDLPLAGSKPVTGSNATADVYYIEVIGKKKTRKVPRSRLDDIWTEAFGHEVMGKVTELEAARDDKTNTHGKHKINSALSRWRARRSIGKGYFRDARKLSTAVTAINNTDCAGVRLMDGDGANGPEPFILYQKVKRTDLKTKKEVMGEDNHRPVSVATLLSYVGPKSAPITEAMTWEALLAVPPKKGGKRAPQPGKTGEAEGLGTPAIKNINQFEGTTAEYATALANPGIQKELTARLYGADSDDLLISVFRIARVLSRFTSNGELRKRYDTLSPSGVGGDVKVA